MARLSPNFRVLARIEIEQTEHLYPPAAATHMRITRGILPPTVSKIGPTTSMIRLAGARKGKWATIEWLVDEGPAQLSL